MRQRYRCCKMHIRTLLWPSRTMLIRYSMEQSITIIVPWPPLTIKLQLWKQKLFVFGKSWQGSLERILPPKPRCQSHQHLQALKIRCICMIGWARLLYTVWHSVLYWMIRKSCIPSPIYVLLPVHIWNHIMTRLKQDWVLVFGKTLSKNSKIFMDNEITRREQKRN